MGYWPSKIICLLNVINQLGWGIIASIIAGQMFSAVNGAGLSIAVGCVISALCMGLIATFGIAILHTYERCAPCYSSPYHEKRERKAYSWIDTPGYRKFSPSLSSLAPLAATSTPPCHPSVPPAQSPPTAAPSSPFNSPWSLDFPPPAPTSTSTTPPTRAGALHS